MGWVKMHGRCLCVITKSVIFILFTFFLVIPCPQTQSHCETQQQNSKSQQKLPV